MNSGPTPTPEAIVSLPVSTAAIGLLLTIGSVILAILLVTRRKRRDIKPVPGIDDVPWLVGLIEGLPQAALIADPNGRLAACNATARRVLSLDAQARGLPLSLAALVARMLDSETAETTEIPTSIGRSQYLRVTASPLESLGRRLGALVLIHDPTEESESTESYRYLISAMAHELRTPLTAILGHADILGSCQPEKDDALWRRPRDFIASETERLARLVEDLLRLSRLDLTPLQRLPVNLRAVAEEAVSALFQTAEARGIQLALQSPPSLPRVLGDRDRLHQVFVNLLDNAIKYSSAGGKVSVHLSPEGEAVLVEVQDEGVGITPEDLPRIFDPLYRSEDVRDKSGTGLGLTIVRMILEQHGTSISVQSAPSQGSIFYFRLSCTE